MEHLFTVECQPFVPNPYALVHVAAARARALRRGVPPRLKLESQSPGCIALREIAAGAFTSEELLNLPVAQPDMDDLPEPIGMTENQLLTAPKGLTFERPAAYAGKETITQEWTV
jgi:DNA-directed RNA polymerase subunit omega